LAQEALVSNKIFLINSKLGYVFEAYDKAHKMTVAVKRTTKAGEYVSREYEVLDRLRDNPNVI
jgi:hypothetical protein